MLSPQLLPIFTTNTLSLFHFLPSSLPTNNRLFFYTHLTIKLLEFNNFFGPHKYIFFSTILLKLAAWLSFLNFFLKEKCINKGQKQNQMATLSCNSFTCEKRIKILTNYSLCRVGTILGQVSIKLEDGYLFVLFGFATERAAVADAAACSCTHFA